MNTPSESPYLSILGKVSTLTLNSRLYRIYLRRFMNKNLAGLDLNALLQKAEEGVKVLEEEVTKHHIAEYDPQTQKPIWHDGGFLECAECNSNSNVKQDFHTRDEPLTGIEEMRGTEHAYYEKQLEEMGKLLEEVGGMMKSERGEFTGEAHFTKDQHYASHKGRYAECPECFPQRDWESTWTGAGK